MSNFVEAEKQEFFEYLETLRESGVINMYGAATYLQEAFDLTRSQSRELLKEWMENYGTR
jgi:hypothetical protein